jgi:Fic family protein
MVYNICIGGLFIVNKKDVLAMLCSNNYYTVDELRYNTKVGKLFSKEELSVFIALKREMLSEGNSMFIATTLKSFNSDYIFFCKGGYISNLLNDYLSIFLNDVKQNKQSLFSRNYEDILESRIFSEIEGTLNIENVPTTHKRIQQICSGVPLSDKNDIIIKNMKTAIDYINNERPSFNKENLYKLYCLLSDNCLDDEDKLNGNYYRDDDVTVGGFDGAPVDKIDECMNSLFAFVNTPSIPHTFDILIPFICHYYILYVHPYFDYNGRTARMVSYWLSVILDVSEVPVFISEAINETKNNYYKAITNSRITDNDLTYFLGYIMETSIEYSYIYKNIEEIEKKIGKLGNFLSSTERVYLKKILIHNKDSYFNSKMFMEYIGNNMTRQGALKFLNGFVEYDILQKSSNKKGEAIYKINPEIITYRYH